MEASRLRSNSRLRNRHNSIDIKSSQRNSPALQELQEVAVSADASIPYMPEPPQFSLEDREREWSPAAIENGAATSLLPKTTMNGGVVGGAGAPLSPPLTQISGISTPDNLAASSALPPTSYAQPPPPIPQPLVAGWMNMPNKIQLAILAASRFVDFFQMAAIQTFMVHQLKSFDHTLPDSVISHQAGVLQGAFTAAQIITSVLWGRAADQPTVGRKLVLSIGLWGTAFGCVGVAFSKTYGQAVFWRLISGAINGTVGSARTMVAEATPKPWHPRAFLLLPAAFNFANVLGPILAGLLANPVVQFPHLFGKGGTYGGEDGVWWMEAYPYALANLISTIFLIAEAIIVHFFLEETLKGKRPFQLSALNPIPWCRNLYGQIVTARAKGYRALQQAQREGLLAGHERGSMEMEHMNARGERVDDVKPVLVLPFRRIWTPNVLWVLLSIAVFDFHMGAFANLWILFLATPRSFVPEHAKTQQAHQAQAAAAQAAADGAQDGARRLLARAFSSTASSTTSSTILSPRSVFKFYGGLAFPPPTIGFAMAIIGFIGVALQFLLYPWANGKFGLMRCFRGSLFFFPMAYYLAPYLSLLPSTTPPPGPSSGVVVWGGISFVLLLQVAARTFALPASIILLNNSSPHPSVLGTIHGVGQACSATFRTVGPMLAGYWYGTWTDRGVVGMAWWIVGSIAAIGCVASFWVRNGSGHEIFLPGEEGEMKEVDAAGGSGDGR